MSEGILSLFGVALGGAIADILLPGKPKGPLRRALGVLVSLTLLLLILRPVMGLIRDEGGFLEGVIPEIGGEQTDFEAIFADTVAKRSASELEKGIVQLLERDFGIAERDCAVGVLLDGQGELLSVSVRLSGKGLLVDPRAVEQALGELLNCLVEVR